MTVRLETPDVDGLGRAMAALRQWQRDDLPLQLHPGDVGWFWRFGAEATAAAVRMWSRGGHVVAVGLLDGPEVLRLTTAPDARRDDELARQLVDDISRPERGVLVSRVVSVEAPTGALVPELLDDEGWTIDEAWTPLRRDLTEPVAEPVVRIEAITPERADIRVAVQRAAFDGSTFSAERWQAMAQGPAYDDARCLVAFDGHDRPVAAITVWSAGRGRPGLLEPMGVHRDHRGLGYGRAITVAGAAALRELGSSSALVCTRSANIGAVATYRAAGFTALEERWDRRRTT
jgi:ribosomal protein S18 acetylase RimI-like enzyme